MIKQILNMFVCCVVFTSMLNAAEVTEVLRVDFDGTLSETSYTLSEDEFDTTGSFQADTGGAELSAGIATITKDTDRQGFMFYADDYVADTEPNDSFVIEAVINPTYGVTQGDGQNSSIANVFDMGGNLFLRYSGSSFEFGVWDGSSETVSDITDYMPTQSQYVHVAMVYTNNTESNDNIAVYLDGELAGSIDTTNVSGAEFSGTVVSYGNFNHSGYYQPRGFDGKLDAVGFSTFEGTFDSETDFMLLELTGYYAASPSPEVYGTDIAVDTSFSWEAPVLLPSPAKYDLYYGLEDPNDPNLVGQDVIAVTDLTTNSFTPSTVLEYDSTYNWRVDVYSDSGEKYTGQLWEFTTETGLPSITLQPVSQTVDGGDDVTLQVEGENIAYCTWYKTNSSYSVGTGTTLTISDITQADEGVYYCIVENSSVPADTLESDSVIIMTKRLVAHFDFEGDLLDDAGDWDDGVFCDPNEVRNNPDVAFDAENSISGSQSLSFGGEQGYVKVPASLENQNFYKNGFTASCWIKQDEDQDSTYSTGVSNIDYGIGLRLALFLGVNNVRMDYTTICDYDSTSKKIDGWRLIVGTYDPDSNTLVSYWVEEQESGVGLLVSQGSDVYGSSTETELPLVFGAYLGYGDYEMQLKGNLDDVKIWSYPLSSDEVAELYATGADESICTGTVEADLNGDCIVDSEDLAEIAAGWLNNKFIDSEN